MFQNNRIFSILILVPKPLFILFLFSFSKESKVYCIFDCLRKGRNSAKLNCLVSTKNVTCFRNFEQLSRAPTKNDQYQYRDGTQNKGSIWTQHAWKPLEQLLFLPNYCRTRDLALTSSCLPLFIVAYQNWKHIPVPRFEPRTSLMQS